MTDEMIALARRAVACKGWRWMPGMACLWDRPGGAGGQQVVPTWARVVDLPMGPLPLTFCLVDAGSVYRGALPDLTDAATLGCLLALVREAWGDPTATTAATREADGSRGWLADCWNTQSPLSGLGPFKSEAEAIVAALEAAP